jgi:hypothetical protein
MASTAGAQARLQRREQAVRQWEGQEIVDKHELTSALQSDQLRDLVQQAVMAWEPWWLPE